MKEQVTQEQTDTRIRELHNQFIKMRPQIESIIDELKSLGPHSVDGENALLNTQDWLEQLSKR
jgi:hypothetical protein